MTDPKEHSNTIFEFKGSNRFALLGVLFQSLLLLILLFTGYSSSTEIVVIYALETILIGIFHVFKMLRLSRYKRNKGENRESDNILGLILFFIVHYGLFVFVQTNFFFVFMAMGDDRISDGFGLENFIAVAQFPGVQAAAIVITIALSLKFMTGGNNKKNLEVDGKLFMFVPYLRIFIQQFTAILPGLFILLVDGGMAAAVILILLRTGLDLLMIRLRENEQNIERFALFIERNSKEPFSEGDKSNLRTYLKLTLEE